MAFEAKLRISIQHYISVTVGNRHRSPQVSQKNLSRIRKKKWKRKEENKEEEEEKEIILIGKFPEGMSPVKFLTGVSQYLHLSDRRFIGTVMRK